MFDKYGNINLVKGTTFNPVLEYMEPDGVTPIDLTGCQPIMEIKEDLNSSSILSLSLGSGITLEPLLGKILPYISSDVTRDIIISKGYYEILLIWPSQGNLKKSLFNGPKVINFEESVIT